MNFFVELFVLLKSYLHSFLTFMIGFFSGFISFLLLYFFSVFRKFNNKHRLKQEENSSFSVEEMKNLIQEKQKQFKEDNEKNSDEYMLLLVRNCQSLLFEVSSKFYPNSPFPYLELTIDESLILVKYVQFRIDELFNKNIISLFRKITLRKIMTLKQTLVDKKYVDKYKKTNKILNSVSNVVNIINPFHWAKKIFFKTFYNKILEKIGTTIIFIIGEEIYKIYSKKIFETDLNINDIINSIQEEVKNNSKI
ncbi:MAG: hypothetical protein Q8781_00425 [Candidatus Phytoplasma stylosanthis]|uniref:hypothetical protein n=1 Tax=Candidatus Phytoplasma stylosanthis TaxID=2798314 RepID=UPI00293B242E|nr:hypothetical protein [Candidatus Phytoplasma stylosanthis]MDV3167925.1 hypothetical protein [Candidatus Phytoplasma stylosanthis]MDV3170760.1 hypothetical protein [Candidatus Phytoplasma stylosanthis]MDV3174017.1 hypothetical protein [Candidatus Phytoplasma stylosanthis]MDV3202571.1 hypothetical protein [Candidatus Phytoplasma stylosanthis]